MILLFFFLSITFPLGNLQRKNDQDIINPFYNTNKLSSSEPLSIQSISGHIYEENTREVPSNNYDRIYNKNMQPTNPTDCMNNRRVGELNVGSLSDVSSTFNENKENPSTLINDSTTQDFNTDDNPITKNKLIETKKKEAQFDTLIIRNDFKNDHHNKYEHGPKLMSGMTNAFEQISKENLNDDSKMNEQKYKLISQIKNLNLSMDDNLPKIYSTREDDVHESNAVSQKEEDLDLLVSVYSKSESENYKDGSKLIAERNVSKVYEKIEPFAKPNSTIWDQLDQSSDEILYKEYENIGPTSELSRNTDKTFKEPLVENEVDLLTDELSRRNMPDIHYKPIPPQDIKTPIKYNINKTIPQSENSGLQMDNANTIHSSDIFKDSKTNYIERTSCDDNKRRSGDFELEQEDEETNKELEKKETIKQLREPTKGLGISEMVRSRMMIMQHPRVCFACSSISDPTCWFPGRTTSVKYCRDDHASCLTKVFQQKDTRYIIRDCGSSCSVETDVGFNPGYKSCSICHYDLCNGAFSTKIQISIIIILALLHLMYSM